MRDSQDNLAQSTQSETHSKGGTAEATEPELRVVIAYHPHLLRVGDRAAVDPRQQRSIAISRVAPSFGRPAGKAAPIGHARVSRDPVTLTIDDGGGAVLRAATRAFVNGEPLGGERRLTPEQLTTGFTLRLGRTVLFWIQLASRAPADGEAGLGLAGESAALASLRSTIRRVAKHDIPVLVLGESGTGKELVAQAIHQASARHEGPLVRVNMAAIPASMAAAALFGHARGAFTGAVREQAGYFDEAHGGTLFLDEIGDTPIEVQNALLRVLALGEVQRVGETRPRRVNVRLVAATDADVRERVGGGELKLPLLMRLGGYEIFVPPLRDRREDVATLLVAFIEEMLAAQGLRGRLEPPGEGEKAWLPIEVFERLLLHDWPGNVRELRNVASQIVIDCSHAATNADVPLMLWRSNPREPHEVAQLEPPESADTPSRRSLADVSFEEFVQALEDNDWRPNLAARALGISRTSGYALMKRYPGVRRATDLGERDILAALAAAHDDVRAAAQQLQVSERALRLRMTSLRIEA